MGVPLALAGTLLLLVQAGDRGAPAPAPGDALRAEAERALSEASALLGSGKPESRPEALARLDAALRGWRALGDEANEAETLLRRGAVYGDLRRLPDELEDGQAALGITQRLGDRRAQARALDLIAQARIGQYDYDGAIEAYERAVELRRALGERAEEAALLYDLAYAHRSRGDYGRAVEIARLELELRRRLGDRSLEAWALMSLGAACISAGAHQEAIDTHREALAMFRELGDRESEGLAVQRLGAFYQGLGDSRAALTASEEALAIFRVHKNADGEITAYIVAGAAHLSLGDAEKGLEVYLRALRLCRETGERSRLGAALIHVGNALSRLKRYEEALPYLEEARSIAAETKNIWTEAEVLAALGTVHLGSGRIGEARVSLRRAAEMSRATNSRIRETKVLNQLARIARDQGDLADARAQLEAAVRNVEADRAGLASPGLRSALVSAAQQTYELYVDVLMALDAREPGAGHRERALEAAELARARGLLDQLAEAGIEIRQGVEPGLLQQERRAQEKLSAALDRQLRVTQDPVAKGQEEAAARAVRTLTIEWEAAREKVRTRSPRFSALREPPPITVDEIRADVLDDDTVLLEYALGEARSFLWLVSCDAVQGFELPSRAAVEAAARAARPQLAEPPRRRASASAGSDLDALGGMVLGPLAGRIKGKRLLIVADGALHYVPFAALPDPDGSGQPLVAGHEIVAAPAASVVSLLRRERAGGPPASKTLAVLADPVFERDDERLPTSTRAALAKGGPVAESALAQALRSAGMDRGPARLPFTRREAKAILALVPPDKRQAALDFDASRKTAADSSLADYRFVHFATHGFLNSAEPALSGIILSLYDRGGAEARGFLTAADVFNLQLKAEMVVLSGCQTALGQEMRGEGVVGLSRGFMYAGAPRVVASLWRVDDAATAELMKAFYRGLLHDRLPAGAALRQAQLQMWRRPRLRDPFYWAGFQLQGEWR